MTALAGVSFAVGRGEVFGFLGPNGSGKMSTVRILVTLLRQTSGSGRVGGFDTVREPARVRELIGYAAQATGVDDDLTVHENLALQVLLHRASPAEIKERAEQLVEGLGLSELLNQRVGRLSRGLRRRVDLAQALVHRPDVLFLDEPTTGLDPPRRGSKSLLRKESYSSRPCTMNRRRPRRISTIDRANGTAGADIPNRVCGKCFLLPSLLDG
jgi:ABC-2 type transport system ATP-binding protein